MYEVAFFTANKTDTATHGLKFKPLTAEARVIFEKLQAPDQTQGDGAVATSLDGDLEREVQAGGAGQGTPAAQDDGTKRSPNSVTKRTTSWIGLPGGGASEESDEMKSKGLAQDKAGGARRRKKLAPPQRTAWRRCSNPRPALA